MLIADFASDTKEKLRQFNRILILSENADNSASERLSLVEKFNAIMKFHSEATEFSINQIHFKIL